jgi:polysaccharide chain length determinant protein (PEP-CTERM system associated)
MIETPTTPILLHAQTLRRRWPLAALATAAVVAVLVPISLGLPNVYRSSASLLVNQVPDPAQMQSSSTWQVDERLQAIKQEALSRTQLAELAEQFNLYPRLRADGDIAEMIDRFQKDVKVEITSSVTRNDRVATVAFQVSYVGTDPATVAKVANHIALFYVEKSDEMRTGQASRTAAVLKQELDATKGRLDKMDQRVVSFTASNAGALPQQVTSTIAKYTQATQQLQMISGEQFRLLERRDTLQNEIANLSSPGVTADVTSPAVQLARAQRELDDLKLRFSDSMPEVREKKKEIASLEAVAAEAKATTETTPTRIATLQSQVTGINTRLEQLKKSTDDIRAEMRGYDSLIQRAPVRDAQFEQISRDVQSTRDRYEQLQKRYQDAVLAERSERRQGDEEFQILDAAQPATGPGAPARPLLVIGSVALAVALGIGLVLLLSWFDTSFGSVDELRAFTHVPVLVTIPIISTRAERWRHAAAWCAIGAAAAVALTAIGIGVFHGAQHADGIARMLLRFA